MKHLKINNEKLEQQIELLKQIYNIKTDTKLVKHIVNLDYNKHK
jgi:precorrin isomerase